MTEQTDFWLQLHQLTTAYKAAGTTQDDRTAAIVAQLKPKGSAAKREAADELLTMATALASLYARVTA